MTDNRSGCSGYAEYNDKHMSFILVLICSTKGQRSGIEDYSITPGKRVISETFVPHFSQEMKSNTEGLYLYMLHI